MRKFLSLAVFLAILIGVDLGAKSIAEEQVKVRAEDAAPRGSEVSASIRSFPFLGRLFLSGTISESTVELRNVAAPGITFARVSLELHGVQMNRDRLLSEQDAEIEAVDSGVVTIEISQEALSEKLGIPIVIAGGEVNASVNRVSARVPARVEENVLVLDLGPAGERRVAIPETNYAPCVGRLTLLAGRARFQCRIDEVPPALLGVANRAA